MKNKLSICLGSFCVAAVFLLKCWMEVSVNGWKDSTGTLLGCLLGAGLFVLMTKCNFYKIFQYTPIVYLVSILAMLLLQTPLAVYTNGVFWHLGLKGRLIFTPACFAVAAALSMFAYLYDRKMKSNAPKIIWIILEFCVIWLTGSLIRHYGHTPYMICFFTISTIYVVYSLIESFRPEYIFHMLGLGFVWSSLLFRLKLRWFGSETQMEYNRNYVKMRAEALARGGLFGTGAESEYKLSNLYIRDDQIFAFAEKNGVFPVILFIICIVALGLLAFSFALKLRRKERHGAAMLSFGIGIHILTTLILFVITGVVGASLYAPVQVVEINMTCMVFFFEMGLLFAAGIAKKKPIAKIIKKG